MRLLDRLCRSGEVSLDIGANLGLYAIQIAERSAGCHAFEPHPKLAARLARCRFPRLVVHGVAVSDEDGYAELRVPVAGRDELDGNATIEARNPFTGLGEHSVRRVEVERVRLDTWSERHGVDGVGFIKIDVEGHETCVLHGGMRLIERSRPNVLIEVEERHRPGSLDEVFDFMATRDYRGYFWSAGALAPLEEFSPQHHQRIDRIKCGGVASPDYVSNFVFLPRESIHGPA